MFVYVCISKLQIILNQNYRKSKVVVKKQCVFHSLLRGKQHFVSMYNCLLWGVVIIVNHSWCKIVTLSKLVLLSM